MKTGIISYLYIVFFIAAALVDHLPFLSIMKRTSLSALNSLQTINSNELEDMEKKKILLEAALYKQGKIPTLNH